MPAPRTEEGAQTVVAAARFDSQPHDSGERERFLRHAAHELRAPIAAIAGYAQLCLEEPTVAGDADLTENLETIAECAERLERLVSGLFDLMRLEATQAIDAVPVDVADTVGEAAGLARPFAADRGVQLHVRVTPESPRLYGDPIRLLALVDHLLRNAIEATSPGGAVQVSARCTDGRIVIKIADTGCGIPAEEIPRLFSVFHRISRADRCNHRGPGLGLAICRAIAQAHGGMLSVESQEHLGTVATVTLPL
jgi:two-component system cell cycle sensor histidine kinase PleC